MKQTLSVLTVLDSMAVPGAHAQSGNVYLGAGAGVADFDDDGTAYKFYGGYRASPNLVLEGGYRDFGEAESGSFADETSGFNVSALGLVLSIVMGVVLLLPAVPVTMAAGIDQRTAIICLSTDSSSLVSLPEFEGSSNSDKVVSSFTQWMFDADKQASPSRIRFLWVPGSADRPPALEISTSDANHSTVRIMSQTRHGILAATSASARMTNIGWLFAINFKSEHVIATTLFSNLGGSRAQSFSYSCRFDNPPGAAKED